MEKEKRKRKDTPLSPRQRYLPLVIMGGLFFITIALPFLGISWFLPYPLFETTIIPDNDWLQITRIAASQIWAVAIILIPIGIGVYLFLTYHRYKWSWEFLVFGLLATPIVCLHSIVFLLSVAYAPVLITSFEYESNRYHIQLESPSTEDIYMFIEHNFYLFKCDNHNANCERYHIGFNVESDSPTDIASIELIVVENRVGVCVINPPQKAFLLMEPFDTDRDRLIWDHPVEYHPQCNAESFQ